VTLNAVIGSTAVTRAAREPSLCAAVSDMIGFQPGFAGLRGRDRLTKGLP